MVQGGYNVVLHPDDSFEKHYDDTLRGGGLINDQELAWTLVTQAPDRIIVDDDSLTSLELLVARTVPATLASRRLAARPAVVAA